VRGGELRDGEETAINMLVTGNMIYMHMKINLSLDFSLKLLRKMDNPSLARHHKCDLSANKYELTN
ncbi:hypothetical protein ACJX0J_011598, partial [Zea mays]